MSEQARPPLSGRAQLAVLWFLLLGAVGAFVAGHDILYATQLGIRLLAGVVLFVCVGLLIGSIGLLLREHWAYVSLAVSGLGVAVAAVLGAFAQWINDVRDWRVVFWVAIASVSAVCSWWMLREGHVDLGIFARRRVRVVSSLVSIGALVSLAQFWNAAIRVPPAAAPSLSVTSALKELPKTSLAEGPSGAAMPMRRFQGTVHVKNTGSSKVWVLSSLYNVLGGRAWAGTKPPSRFDPTFESNIAVEHVTYGTARHFRRDTTQLVETGQLLGANTYMVPGDEYTFNFSFFTPPRTYDLLRLEALFYVSKETLVLDESHIPQLEVHHEGGQRRLILRRPLRDTSWFSRLVRGDRVLITEVIIERPNGHLRPTLWAYVNRGRILRFGDESSYETRMIRLYGIAIADSRFELSVVRP